MTKSVLPHKVSSLQMIGDLLQLKVFSVRMVRDLLPDKVFSLQITKHKAFSLQMTKGHLPSAGAWVYLPLGADLHISHFCTVEHEHGTWRGCDIQERERPICCDTMSADRALFVALGCTSAFVALGSSICQPQAGTGLLQPGETLWRRSKLRSKVQIRVKSKVRQSKL